MSSAIDALPIVDLEAYLTNPSGPEAAATSKQIVDILSKTSCLIVKDPRVTFEDNDVFIDTMEKYYNQPDEVKRKDARPEFHYQVGATPEGTEVPRDHEKIIENVFKDAVKPMGGDKKWRFFWRAGELPKESEFPQLNMPKVIPDGFPEWESVMNKWSGSLLQAVHTVAELFAIGCGLEKNTITEMMKCAPHLLAPTGSDLNKHNQIGTVFAGFHYDLNLLTIHGASRYPGLSIWLRDGTKIPVRVPKGCLLLQAGKQLEWLTGGFITAGFHEVVVTEDTLKAVEKAKELNRPLWRVSSTLFSHIASDQVLKPLKEEWNTPEAQEKYPPTKCGKQVQDELKSINLAKM